MKILVILLTALSLLVVATPVTLSSGNQDSYPLTSFFINESLANKHILAAARRGCCSWHGGVCGCDNGRVVCCDGTLSPTCT